MKQKDYRKMKNCSDMEKLRKCRKADGELNFMPAQAANSSEARRLATGDWRLATGVNDLDTPD
jgi:hypothetical protein